MAMQNLDQQILDKIGTTEGAYDFIDQGMMDDWITQAHREIVNTVFSLNPMLLHRFCGNTAVTDSSGKTATVLTSTMISHVSRNDGDFYRPCDLVHPRWEGELDDISSPNLATPLGPKYYFKNGTLFIKPNPTGTRSGNISHVKFVDHDASAITGLEKTSGVEFPTELNPAVVLYALIQAKIREIGYLRTQGQDAIELDFSTTNVVATFDVDGETEVVCEHNAGHFVVVTFLNAAGQREDFMNCNHNEAFTIVTVTFAVEATGTIYINNSMIMGALIQKFEGALPVWQAPTEPTISEFFPSQTLTDLPAADTWTPSFSLTAKPANVAAFSPSITLTAIPNITSFAPGASPTYTVSGGSSGAPVISGGSQDLINKLEASDVFDVTRLRFALEKAADFLHEYWDEDAAPAAVDDDVGGDVANTMDAFDFLQEHDTEEVQAAVSVAMGYLKVAEGEMTEATSLLTAWATEASENIKLYVADIQQQAVIAKAAGDKAAADASAYSSFITASANAYGDEVQSDSKQFAARISAEAGQIAAEANAYTGEHSADVRMYGDRIQAEAALLGAEAQAFAATSASDAKNYASVIQGESAQIGAEANAYGKYLDNVVGKYVGDIQSESARNQIAVQSALGYLQAAQMKYQIIQLLFSRGQEIVPEIRLLTQEFDKKVASYCGVPLGIQQQQSEQQRR